PAHRSAQGLRPPPRRLESFPHFQMACEWLSFQHQARLPASFEPQHEGSHVLHRLAEFGRMLVVRRKHADDPVIATLSGEYLRQLLGRGTGAIFLRAFGSGEDHLDPSTIPKISSGNKSSATDDANIASPVGAQGHL